MLNISHSVYCVSVQLRGVRTQVENIADNGGIRAAVKVGLHISTGLPSYHRLRNMVEIQMAFNISL